MLGISKLQKSFPGHFELILKSIDLELKKGDFCIVIGSNGSGKSTLMRSISGEYRIDAGEIVIDSQDVSMRSARYRAQYIACVTQDVNQGTIPEMSLLENMVLSRLRGKKCSLRFYSQDEAEILNIVRELGVRLDQYIHSPLSVLSGGQRQIVATLMAITSEPHLLLLDEHTSALDPQTQKLLMEYTTQYVAKLGITTIMITHKLDDAIRYGNRLIMLHKGQIVLDLEGAQKQALKVEELLALFHKYEDMTLKAGEGV